MPIYNGQQYLKAAIDSVLGQTERRFELIIINDGSRDDSEAIIKTYHDPRIRYYTQSNQGLAATLNRGIKLASGTYIARQDQDDVSKPERLAKQLDFLEKHPKHGMVGTWACILKDERDTKRFLKHPAHNSVIKFALLFDNPFVHSSIMIRKSVLDTVGLYTTNPNRQPPEDYELWSRIARVAEVANIPEVLLIYREVTGSMSRTQKNPFLEKVITISTENITNLLEKPVTDHAIRALAILSKRPLNPNEPSARFKEVKETMDLLIKSLGNQHKEILQVLKKMAVPIILTCTINYSQNHISKVGPMIHLKIHQAVHRLKRA